METELPAMLLKGMFVKRNREGTEGRDRGAMEDSVCVLMMGVLGPLLMEMMQEGDGDMQGRRVRQSSEVLGRENDSRAQE